MATHTFSPMDGGNLPIRFELNLQKISITAIAIKIWESPFARQKVREFFEKFQSHKLEKFSKITDEVISQLQKIRLPEKVLLHLQNVAIFIGEKIYYWTLQVNVFFDLQRAEKIFWTCYGTVDEAKTFQIYWQNDPRLRHNTFRHSIYTIACILGQEKFVADNFSAMKKKLKEYCEPDLTIPEDISQHCLISLFVCFYLGKDKFGGLQLYRQLNFDVKTNSVNNAELLRMCAQVGYLNAFKYFANNLGENRRTHLVRAVKDTVKTLRTQMPNESRDNYIEILLFTINNMIVEGIDILREHLHRLFYVIANVWPYQELFLQLVNYALPYMEEDKRENLLISVLSYFAIIDENRRTPACTVIGHQVLEKALASTSREVKKKILIDSGHLLPSLAVLNDFSTFMIILKDPDVVTYRDQIIEKGDAIFKSCVENAKFDNLNKFIDGFLREDEKAKFKSKFNIYLMLFAERQNFEFCNKLLNWLADSTEEKLRLKTEIDSIQMLRSFYETKKFSLFIADNFLNWQFDGNEERIKLIKILLRTENFVREEFFNIWCGNRISSLGSANARSEEFLNFFDLPSEEMGYFKRDVIIADESFLPLFCRNLSLPENFKTVDELLTFCCVSAEKVKQMKRNILTDIRRGILHLSIEKKAFKIAFHMVNWVVEENGNKREIIGKLLNSPQGGELCRVVIRTCTSSFFENVVILFNLWIKPFGDIQITMEHCLDPSMIGEHETSQFKALFEILERKGFLSKNDVQESLPRR